MEQKIISAQWFEVGVRYDKVQEDGTSKKVTENYIVDAMSFTEAEEAITAEVSPYISAEFKITSSRIAAYKEVILNEGEKFFKCKIAVLTIDEKSGAEKMAAYTVMIRDKSFLDALQAVVKYEDASMDDWRFLDLQETKFVDVVLNDSNKEDYVQKN